MAKNVRPSRLWPVLFKYYLFAFLLALPYLYKILMEMGHQIILRIVEYSQTVLGLNTMSMGIINIVSNFSRPLFFVAIFVVIVAEIKRFRIKYIFFEDGVVKKVGILNTNIRDVSYDHIDYFHIHRTLGEKILGTGDLKIKTPADQEALTLEGVGRPKKWGKYIIKRAELGGKI